MERKKIIAVDFDDTITLPSPYPITGELNPEAKKYLKLLYNKGYSLILWTSRVGIYYDEALRLIIDWDLPVTFDYLNKNKRGTTGKLVADFYIDDKSLPDKLNWEKIYNYIINNV